MDDLLNCQIPRNQKIGWRSRVHGWLNPLHPLDLQLYNEELERIRAAQAVLKAEAQRLQAETALIDEANERERKKTSKYHLVARIEYTAVVLHGSPKKEAPIRIMLLLEENADNVRRIKFRCTLDKNGSAYNGSEDDIKPYLAVLPSYQLVVEPWLNNQSKTNDLEKKIQKIRDTQFVGIHVVE